MNQHRDIAEVQESYKRLFETEVEKTLNDEYLTNSEKIESLYILYEFYNELLDYLEEKIEWMKQQ